MMFKHKYFIDLSKDDMINGSKDAQLNHKI